MTYLPDEKEIALIETSKIPEHSRVIEAAVKLYKILVERPKNIISELSIFRKYCPILIKEVCVITDLNKKAIHEKNQAISGTTRNQNKRWTKEEDNVLIEMACDPDQNIQTLSTMFGRSPASIANRITTLVGVKRLSQEVAGRFIGYINGEKTEADIAGTVHKEVV